MPAKKVDLLKLIKTVKDTLQNLTLVNVFYEQPDNGQLLHAGHMPLLGGAHAFGPMPFAPYTIGYGSGYGVGHGVPPFAGPQQPTSAPLATIPEEDAALPGPVAPSIPDNEQWYETADTLSETLHLKHCDIRLSREDTKRLRDKLATEIEGLEQTKFTMSEFITEYVLSGAGVGFAMGVAETIKLERERESGTKRVGKFGG